MKKEMVEFEVVVRRLTTRTTTKTEWQKMSDTAGENQYGYGPPVERIEVVADEVFKRRLRRVSLARLTDALK